MIYQCTNPLCRATYTEQFRPNTCPACVKSGPSFPTNPVPYGNQDKQKLDTVLRRLRIILQSPQSDSDILRQAIRSILDRAEGGI